MSTLFDENRFESEIDSKVKTIVKNEIPATNYYSAKVIRKDSEGVWWVRLDGNDEETPVLVNKVDMSVGDMVTVMVRDHQTFVDGNLTSPPMSAINAQNYVDTVVARNIEAVTADIGYLQADVATIGYAQIEDADITNARIQNLVTQYTSLEGSFNVLEANALTANSAVITNLEAQTAKVENLTAENLEAAVGYIEELESENITTGDIQAATGYIHDLEADNITTGDIQAATGYIHDLEADNITTGDIQAATGYIGVLQAGNVTASNIVSDHGTITNLDSNYAHITHIDANTAVIDNAKIGYADVTGLSANFAQITNGHINSALIDTAAIVDEQVFNVTGNKATIARIDASKINVANLRASNLIVDRINGQPVLGGYVTVNSEASGYSSMNPAAQGWYEFTAGGFVLSQDTVVDSSKVYYSTTTPVELYDQGYIDNLESQMNQRIDGAIEVYSGTDVPLTVSTSYPYSEWYDSTQSPVYDVRAEHVGNIYYVIDEGYYAVSTSISGYSSKNPAEEDWYELSNGVYSRTSDTEVANGKTYYEPNRANGYCYRFYYDNTSHEYAWVLIKDSDVTAALGRITDLETFESTTTTWIDETDRGIETIRQNHTELSGVVAVTVKATRQLWYTKSNTTPPTKPTDDATTGVTNNSSTGNTSFNQWNLAVPVYNSLYPNYFYCWEYELSNGKFRYSAVVYDQATTEAEERARTGVANAATAQNTANANIKQSIQLWKTVTQATTTVNKPFSDNSSEGTGIPVTTTTTNANTWTVAVPTYNATYPKYYYCYQQQKGDGKWTCTAPIYDQATTEAMSKAQAALPQGTYEEFIEDEFSDIVSAVDEQSSTLTKLTESVQYGGVNLVWDTVWKDVENSWSTWGSPTTRDVVESNGKRWLHVVTSGGTAFQGYSQNGSKRNGAYEVEPETKYTLSFVAYASVVKTFAPVGIHWRNAAQNTIISQNWPSCDVTTEPKQFSFTITTPANCREFNIMVGSNSSDASFGVWVAEVKLERGPYATPWDYSTGDVTTISNTVSSVKQTADGVREKFSQLTQTLGTNADGTTATNDIMHRMTSSERTLDGISQTVSQSIEESMVGPNVIPSASVNPNGWTVSAPSGANYTKTAYGTAGTKVTFSSVSGYENLYSSDITVTAGRSYTVSVDYTVGKDYNVTANKSSYGLGVYNGSGNPGNAYDDAMAAAHACLGKALFITKATRVTMTAVCTFTAISSTVVFMLNGGHIADGQTGLEFTIDNVKMVENISSRVTQAESDISQTAQAVTITAGKLETVANPNLSPFFESAPYRTATTYDGGYWRPTTDNWLMNGVTQLTEGWAHVEVGASSRIEIAPPRIGSVDSSKHYTLLIEWRGVTVTGSPNLYARNYPASVQFSQNSYHKQWSTSDPSSGAVYVDMAVDTTAKTGAWQAAINLGMTNGSNITFSGDLRLSLYESAYDSATSTWIPYSGPWKPYSGNQLYASQSELKVEADKISMVVDSSSSSSSVVLTQNALTAIADNIVLSGTTHFTNNSTLGDYVGDAIDDIEIGGRNLLKNSGTFDGWLVSNVTFSNGEATGSASGKTSNVNYLTRYWVGTGVLSDYIGKTVTVSFEVYSDDWSAVSEGTSYTGLGAVVFQFNAVTGTPYGSTIGSTGRYFFSRLNNTTYFNSATPVNGKWVRVTSKPLTIDSSLFTHDTSLVDGYDYLAAYFILVRRNGTVKMRHPQIELGNKATDWIPAPEDMASASDSVEYINGTQTAATGSWTGVTKDSALYAGKTIAYRLPYAGNGNASLQLKDSSGNDVGGNVAVYSMTTRVTTHYPAGSIIQMTYDGTNWRTAGWYNTNNYDRTLHNNYVKAASNVTSGALVCGTASGYRQIAASATFDIAYPILWAGGAWTSGTQYANAYEAYPSVNPATTATVEGIGVNKTVFLKGSISGNTFTCAASNFLTCVSATTEDGYFYIPLGIVANDATTKMYFSTSKDVYAYVDGLFRQVTPTDIVATQKVYYRSKVSGTVPAPSTWITKTTDQYNATVSAGNTGWSTKVTPISSDKTNDSADAKYLYLYTVTQRKRLDGTVKNSSTNALLDDSTTVIDGGSIITNSITANQINTLAIDIGSFGGSIGGRNLALMSDSPNLWALYNSAAYEIARVKLAEDFVQGSTYTVTIWGGPITRSDKTSCYYSLYWGGGNFSLANCDLVSTGVYRKTFTVSTTNTAQHTAVAQSMCIYNTPAVGASGTTYSAPITKIMIEKGSVSTNWTPAPEDAEAEIRNRYGTCSTDAATPVKVVALSGFTLFTGAQITVRFDKGNTAANIQLNVNSTGQKKVVVNGTENPVAAHVTWRTYTTCDFTYDGSYWRLTGTDQTSTMMTRIDDNGISIHPSSTTDNRTVINANGLTVYRANNDVGTFGDTARVGKENSSRFLMNADNLQAYNSSNQKYFEVSTSGMKYGSNLSSTVATTEDINNIKIGGRNLLRNTGSPLGYLAGTTPSVTTYLAYSSEGGMSFSKSVSSTSAGIGFSSSPSIEDLVANEKYTVSLLMKSSVERAYHLQIRINNDGADGGAYIDQTNVTVPANTWTRLTHTFNAFSSRSVYVRLYNAEGTAGTIYVKELQLEKGTKATAWQAAEEDRVVGGRNLLVGSADFAGWSVNYADIDVTDGVVTFTPTSSLRWMSVASPYIPFSEVDGKTVTISFDCRSDDFSNTSGSQYVYVNVRANGTGPSAKNGRTKYRQISTSAFNGVFVPTSTWERHSITVDICEALLTSGSGTCTWFGVEFYDYTLNSMQLRNIKLELGNVPTEWGKAEEDDPGNVPSLSPFFEYLPFDPDKTSQTASSDKYWVSGWGQFSQLARTPLEDGWMHVVLDNTSGSSVARADFDMQPCSDVAYATDYTFLFEFRNNTSTGSNTFYVVQSDNNQFWGGSIKENLSGVGATTSSTNLNTDYLPNSQFTYEKRFVKTSEAADSSRITGELIGLCTLVVYANAGVKAEYDVRVSLYPGRYLGPWKPYVGSLLYADDATMRRAEENIAAALDVGETINATVQGVIDGMAAASLLEITSTGYSFNLLKTNLDGLTTEVGNLRSYVRIESENNLPVLKLGSNTAPVYAALSNEALEFRTLDGAKIAYFMVENGVGKLKIDNAVVLRDLEFSHWKWSARGNGNLSLKWTEV